MGKYERDTAERAAAKKDAQSRPRYPLARPVPIRGSGYEDWGTRVQTQERPAVDDVVRVLSKYGGSGQKVAKSCRTDLTATSRELNELVKEGAITVCDRHGKNAVYRTANA